MRELKDRVVVITGAASGIGRELARALAPRGARLALVDRDAAGLGQVASELEGEVSTHVADVGDRVRMEQLADEVVASHRRVEVLINNAGVTIGDRFESHSLEDADWLLQVNLMGVLHGTRFFLPHLQAAEWGHIVNLSSMFGFFGMPGQALYSASKFAVRGFTEALAVELDGTSVSLTSVHPGGIRTNIIRSARMSDAQAQRNAAATIERWGTPAEKAAAKIIRAIEHQRRRVRIGPDAVLADWLSRLFPVGFQRLLALAFRRAG